MKPSPVPFLAAACLTLTVSPSPAEDFGEKMQVRPQGWEVPAWKEGKRQGRKWLDLTPLIDGDETKAVGFVGRQYPLFVVWSIDGDRFAVIIDEDGRAPFEYGLWDMNGDGVFETKTGAYRKILAPRWVVDKYFARRGLVPPPGRSSGAGEQKKVPAPASGSG